MSWECSGDALHLYHFGEMAGAGVSVDQECPGLHHEGGHFGGTAGAGVGLDSLILTSHCEVEEECNP